MQKDVSKYQNLGEESSNKSAVHKSTSLSDTSDVTAHCIKHKEKKNDL